LRQSIHSAMPFGVIGQAAPMAKPNGFPSRVFHYDLVPHFADRFWARYAKRCDWPTL
jgi:hypothetical protein